MLFSLISFICNVKVLILHQHFNTPYSGGAIRSYYLAKALVDHGIETVVITGSNEKEGIELIDGIEVHYLSVPYANHFGFAKRAVSFLRFIAKATGTSLKINDVDVCYAISVPMTVGLVAMRLKKKKGIPFVFEVGDLWPAAPIELGFVKNPLLKKYLQFLERRIYSRASAIVGLSTPIADTIGRTIQGKPIHMLTNIADVDFYKPEIKNSELEKKFRTEGKFVVAYIGALGFANGLTNLLDAAHECLRQELPVVFLICGDGAERNFLSEKIESDKLRNVQLLPFTNRQGVREILNVTDACFVCYRPYSILETGSPNKYFDALAAGKIVITNFGGWIEKDVTENDVGFSYCNNPEEFVRKLRPYLEDNDLFLKTQRKSRKLAEVKYSRAALSEKFLEVIRSVKA
jgi:glycosyltransferase involved in cell wall biosynthesis